MKKGISQGLVLLLIVGGIILASQSGLLSPATVVGGCEFIEPQFGRIECEPISHVPIRNVYTLSAVDYRTSNYVIKCGDDENTPECDQLTIYCKPDSSVFQYQTDDPLIVRGEPSCPIGGTRWCYIDVTPDVEITLVSTVRMGSSIRVGGCRANFILPPFTRWYTGAVNQYYIPYGLNVYDSGQKLRYNTKSCSLGSLSWTERDDVCIEGCDKIKESDRLGFDDWVNWLSGWNTVPIDLSRKVVTYNNMPAYCSVNQLYSISEFRTESACYKYPSTLIKSVACCPGMETANSICGDDFMWHPIIVGECDANRPCPIGYECQDNYCVRKVVCMSDFECTGQGRFVPDYSESTPTVVKYGCVDGQCKIIDRKTVDCVPPTQGCPSGYVCNPETFVCEKQEGPSIECGDLVCSPPWENFENCPEDCPLIGCEWWDIACHLEKFYVGLGKTVTMIALVIIGWIVIKNVWPILVRRFKK